MSFDVTALSTYVQNNSKPIATKAVAGSKTAKLLIDNKQVQVGVKGSANILKMDADVTFQDGSTCGRSALGATTLSDKQITVKPIKDVQDFCPKSLYNTYFATMIAQGQNPENESMDAAFAASIMEYRAAKVANAVEVILWQGDTASSNANLNKFNGLLKQISTASDKIALTETGADIIAKLQNIYTQMPVAVRKAQDFRIFIGEDMYDSYLIALAGKNIFKPTDDVTLFGTAAKLEVVPGLNGTNKIVAGKISDLQLGLDGTDDADRAVLKYSMETEKWYMDFHFAVGVAAVYTSQIGYVAFA
ncbi:MAG: hypothetical protein ACJ749_11825 [Flavisolibacter sp.]